MATIMLHVAFGGKKYKLSSSWMKLNLIVASSDSLAWPSYRLRTCICWKTLPSDLLVFVYFDLLW
jgi:hypothetical protein